MFCDVIHNSTWRALPSSRNFWNTSRITSCSRRSGSRPRPTRRSPGIADRHRDPQLAALRFRSCRVVHPGADDPQLELADAALHPKQQAVVRPARIVHAIEVDDTRIHQSTQFQEMMPVAAIASEPRGIEAEHSSDLPGAQRRDQAVEAWSVDSATRRPPKYFVDNLHSCESTSPCVVKTALLSPLPHVVT